MENGQYFPQRKVTQSLKVTESKEFFNSLVIWVFFGLLYQMLARNQRQRGRNRGVLYLYAVNTDEMSEILGKWREKNPLGKSLQKEFIGLKFRQSITLKDKLRLFNTWQQHNEKTWPVVCVHLPHKCWGYMTHADVSTTGFNSPT